MIAKAKVTAILINPDGVWEEEIPVVYEDPRALGQAGQQIIHAIVRGWSLVHTISETETEFISLMRVKSLNVKISKVLVATVADAELEAKRQGSFGVLPGDKS